MVAIQGLKITCTHSWWEYSWIYTFPKVISTLWNVKSRFQDGIRLSTSIPYDDKQYATNSKSRLCGDPNVTVKYNNKQMYQLAEKEKKKVGLIGWEKWSTENFTRH